MHNPEDDDNHRSLLYKGLLTGAAFFSNYESISSVAAEATSTYAPPSNPNTYKFTGGSAIGCSSIALILIIAIYLKYLFDKIKNNNPPNLPTAYLVFLSLSCVLSIIGSILLIADENQKKNPQQPVSDLHIAGAVLYVISKCTNPILTSLFAAYSLVENNKNGEGAEYQEIKPEKEEDKKQAPVVKK